MQGKSKLIGTKVATIEDDFFGFIDLNPKTVYEINAMISSNNDANCIIYAIDIHEIKRILAHYIQ